VGAEEDDGVLFDETIAAYSARRKRAEELLTEALVESQRKAFRAYLQRPQWSTIAEDASASDLYPLAVTPELDEPLRVSALDQSVVGIRV
jgi:RAD50-interacting protein 1